MESSLISGAVGVGGNGMVMPHNNDESPGGDSTVTGASSSDDPKQNLTHVINSIQKTLGTIHQLYLTVSSFNVASQLPLLQRLNTLVLELDNMTKLAEKCNIQIPMEVLNLIDDGKNPDEFTRDVLNGCIAKNQITKGKTDAFKAYRKHLLEELEQAFPDEVEGYREIRAASAAERESGVGNKKHLLEELEQAFPDEVEGYREIRAASAAETKRLAQTQSMLPNGDVKVKPEM